MNQTAPERSAVGYGRRSEGMILDAGLRAYMLRVYNIMMLALALTGIFALGLFSLSFEEVGAGRVVATSMGATIFGSGIFPWVLLGAMLLFPILFSVGVRRFSLGTTLLFFVLYCASIGFLVTMLLSIYQPVSVANAFFATAATFGALSLYGYTTRRDLSGFHTFLFMGLVGVLIAVLVNFFLQSSVLQMVISVITILVFAGLTAYDTQRIKSEYIEVAGTGEAEQRSALSGAFSLYLNFIAIFVHLLHLFGATRE